MGKAMAKRTVLTAEGIPAISTEVPFNTTAAEDEAAAEVEYEQAEAAMIHDNPMDEIEAQKKILRGLNNAKHKNANTLPEITESMVFDDHTTRWEKFQKNKGHVARNATKLKKETGHAVILPTEEEVKVVKKGGKVGLQTPKKRQKREQVIVDKKGKPIRKKIEKQPKQIVKELSQTRKQMFEKSPGRKDWNPEDVVDMKGMHPTMKRAYFLFFRDMRSQIIDMTFAQATAALPRMGHPMRYKARMAERKSAARAI